MERNKRLLLQSSAIVMLATGVAGCGGDRSPTPAPTPTPTVSAKQEDVFGVQFGNAFRAANNSEPVNVSDGDIVAISFTTEPVPIN